MDAELKKQLKDKQQAFIQILKANGDWHDDPSCTYFTTPRTAPDFVNYPTYETMTEENRKIYDAACEVKDKGEG